MGKTVRNQFDKCCTFVKLLEASHRVSSSCKNTKEVLSFNMDIETNVINILNSLKNNTYKVGKPREFVIYEPKERVIKALPYRDRVVNNWYTFEVIKPYFDVRFKKDTYACLDNRGTHKAVDVLQGYMRKMREKYAGYYVIKLDIRKYFYSIDKVILYEILADKISDKKILEITKSFIYMDDASTGIGIGAYSSQYFANIYLSKLDFYIKDILKIKYYVRYMDDFVILVEDKIKSKLIYRLVEEFLNKELKLTLNPKSRYYPNKMGINFCGYRIYEEYRLVRNSFKKNVNKRIKLWNKLYSDNKLDKKRFILSYNSIVGHAMHGNSYNLMKKVNSRVNYINQ
ncbi:MAG: reverse transcriptase/maturase family protein [bacterium]|nr:reverse transcriptase/maturase family protein [bacterium]